MTSAVVKANDTGEPPVATEGNVPVRPHILVLVGSYLPGYKAGGPIRSIANLVSALGEEFHFKIVTGDRDLGDNVPFPGIVANRWVRVGQADVMYLQPGLRGIVSIYSLLRCLDNNTILYLNSFYSRPFSMLAIIMRWFKLCGPRVVVLAPRGEFSVGALQLKCTRKRIYTWISQFLRLHDGIIWHASSAFEAADILRQFPKAKYVEAGIVSMPTVRTKKKIASAAPAEAEFTDATTLIQSSLRSKTSGRLKVVFLARCTPMKNLTGALRVLMNILGDISFNIYGPAEDPAYWQECQKLIASLPKNVRVRYWGEIEHARVAQVFNDSDLLLFPTLGENFGHVVSEALLAGCPVLLSDRTPWRRLEELGVGWDLPLSEPARFQKALQECVDMDPEEYAAMRMRAAAFGASRANQTSVIDQNRALFQLAPHNLAQKQ